MSKSTKAITEIKRLMVQFGFMSEEKFVDAVLEDGTAISVEGDQIAEGAKVVVKTEDAEIPAPDGVHSLSDGTKIETKDGIIVSVEEVAKDEEGEEAPEPSIEIEMEEEKPMEEKAPEEEAPVDEEMYALLKDMLGKISDKMKKMESQMSAFETEFNEFKKQPASKPIPNGKTDFSKVLDQEDPRISGILKLRNNK